MRDARSEKRVTSLARSATTSVLVLCFGFGTVHPVRAGAPLHRLADERAASLGLPEPPVATVADETRYVLATGTRVVAYPATYQVAPDNGIVELPATCPAALAGQRVAVIVQMHTTTLTETAAPNPMWRKLGMAQPASCAYDGAPLTVTLPRLDPGERLNPTVFLQAEPPRRIRTRWLELPPAGVLRLSVATADPRLVSVIPPMRLRIRAEGRDGSSVRLLERTLDPRTRARDLEWQELDVSLAPAGPGERRLVFEAKPVGSPDAMVFPLWGDPTIFDAHAVLSPESQRSVILVSFDALRADRLGCYGNSRAVSPVIDGLARSGTLFEVARTQADYTLPSHTTMLTGIYPCTHGMRTVNDMARGLPRRLAPLAALLRGRGYSTAGFTEDGNVDPAVFQRGFDVFWASTGAFGEKGLEPGRAERTMTRARAWLRRHAGEPFFVFLHTYQTHDPYGAPVPYADLFSAYDGADDSRYTSTGVREQLARYDAGVRFADAMLGALLDDVAELGLSGRTIVVITSDHGEAFGEHGQWMHKGELYEENVRVPFIWNAPGLIRAARVADPAVGLIDIVPTVLELLQLPAVPGIQGRSLAPILTTGTIPSELARRVLFTESVTLTGRSGFLAVDAPDWKAIVDPKRARVFHLATDPQEQQSESGDELAPLREARERFDAQCRHDQAALTDGEPQAAPAAPAPEVQRKLRALGYFN